MMQSLKSAVALMRNIRLHRAMPQFAIAAASLQRVVSVRCEVKCRSGYGMGKGERLVSTVAHCHALGLI
jgi:hypothetical protein